MSTLGISTGRVLCTLSVNTEISRWGSDLTEFLNTSINRHASGDWGDVADPDDAAANDHAALLGERVLSAYILAPKLAARVGRNRLWIITEADRASTTVLWPDEY